jgi:hypothetical protein
MPRKEFSPGDRVVTKHPLGNADDFIDTAYRRSGAIGTVYEAYRGHGLCYKVLHDGDMAFYNHDELCLVEEWFEDKSSAPVEPKSWLKRLDQDRF